MIDDVVVIYLFHWDVPLEGGQRPQHYMGSTPPERLEQRVREHLSGGSKQARIMRAAVEAGRDPRLVKTWTATRAEESRLKRGKHGFRHICPVCRGVAA